MVVNSVADCRKSFERLQSVFYKDIFINTTGLRILGIHFMDQGPEWNIKKHRHSFFETHHVTKNTAYTIINDIEYQINAGWFYIMPPGTFHSHLQKNHIGHQGFSLRWEFLSGDEKTADSQENISYELDRLFSQLLSVPAVPMPDKNNILVNDVLSMLKLADQPCSLLELQLVFVRTLMHYAGVYQNIPGIIQNEFDNGFLENRIVNTVIEFMEENYMQDIDVNMVSDSVHLSYSHLSRIFKKHMDKTITQYLNVIRLKNAQHLLLCSKKSLEQIAADTGFNSVNYFCEIFKKYYNISPGSYRNAKLNLSE